MDTSSRSSSQRAVDYQGQAAQLREIARTAPHETLTEELLQLADQYDRLAERASPAASVSEGARPSPEQEVYRSSNGDCWYLVREPGSERMLVRHQPNRASGGCSSLMSIEDFLAEGHTPQQKALWCLIRGKPRTTETPWLRGSERRPFGSLNRAVPLQAGLGESLWLVPIQRRATVSTRFLFRPPPGHGRSAAPVPIRNPAKAPRKIPARWTRNATCTACSGFSRRPRARFPETALEMRALCRTTQNLGFSLKRWEELQNTSDAKLALKASYFRHAAPWRAGAIFELRTSQLPTMSYRNE